MEVRVKVIGISVDQGGTSKEAVKNIREGTEAIKEAEVIGPLMKLNSEGLDKYLKKREEETREMVQGVIPETLKEEN